MKRERWREVAEFPGYEVSDRGRVRSWRPRNGQGERAREPRLLVHHADKDGHLKVGFRSPGTRAKKHRFVHALVLLAFDGPRPRGLLGLHRDGNPENNDVRNLYWGTHKDNARDAIAHGKTARGDRNGARLYPERILRGDDHPARRRPETRPRGEHHYATSAKAYQRGHRKRTSKLSPADALKIFHSTELRSVVARQFRVTPATVTMIRNGKTWSDVTGANRAA